MDLRWPVIHDRYPRPTDPNLPTVTAAAAAAAADEKKEEKKEGGASAATTPPAGKSAGAWKARTIEDLQARYYSLRRKLRDARRRKEDEEAKAKGLPPPHHLSIAGFDEASQGWSCGLAWRFDMNG